MNVTEFPDLERAREQAAEWVAKLDRDLDASERAALRAWCMGPANARALRQMTDLWADLGVMRKLADVFPEGLAQLEARASAAPAGQPAAPVEQAAPRRRSIRPALAAGIAMALVLAGGGAWLLQQQGAAPGTQLADATAAQFTTAVGERNDFELADGSSLAVNTGSLVEVLRLDGEARELRLQRGEALFTVAHDASRPFRVEVGGHVVEAVGTEFDIRLHDGGAVDVMVTDGRVRLLSGGEVTGLFERGEAVRIGADGTPQVSRLEEHQMAARLAWRRGMIEFGGQPLSEALQEFSRYTPVRFVVTDPAAARTPIGGSVPAGDVEWLLEALDSNFGLESSRDPDGSIRIFPKR
jgi:transmembrane sensor